MDLHTSRGAVLLGYGPSDFANAAVTLREAGVPVSNIVLVNNPDGSGRGPINVGEVGDTVDPQKNIGYGAGMNIGRQTLPESVSAVLLLTPGVTLDPQETRDAFEYVEANSEVALCAPILRSPGQDIISSGGKLSRLFKPSHVKTAPASDRLFVPSDWVDGAAIIVRSSLFPIPEEYFLYWEDVALSLQATRSGLKVGVRPQWGAFTSPGAGTRQDLFRYLYWRNRLLCARRLGGPWSLAASLAALLGAAVVRPARQRLGGDSAGARRSALILRRAFKDGVRGKTGPPPDFVVMGSDVHLP